MAVIPASMNKYFLAATCLLSVLAINIGFRWFNSLLPQTLTELHQRLFGHHCTWKNHHPTNTTPDLATPPWFSLLADYDSTIRSGRNLYLWPRPENVSVLRLGNRLFNYAATFGIAWHNRRIPIWPKSTTSWKEYDITKFFNLRIPQENISIIQVLLINYYIPNEQCQRIGGFWRESVKLLQFYNKTLMKENFCFRKKCFRLRM